MHGGYNSAESSIKGLIGPNVGDLIIKSLGSFTLSVNGSIIITTRLCSRSFKVVFVVSGAAIYNALLNVLVNIVPIESYID